MTKSKKYILAIGTAATVVAPLATVVACGSGDSDHSVFNQGHRTVVGYIESSSFGEEERVWDMSVQGKAMTSRNYYDATIPQLFRMRVTQNSKVTIDANSVKKETQSKREHQTFDSISKVHVNSQDYTDFNTLKTAMDNTATNEISFSVKSGVKYVNSKGQETKYEYKAIDLFYGWLRGVYTSQTMREQGTIEGVTQGPKLSAAYLSKLKNSNWYEASKLKSAYDNPNIYLLNLYGVDVQGTIDANTGANKNVDKFTLKFTAPQKGDILTDYLSGNNLFFPVSSEKILEMNSGENDFKTKLGESIQLLEYGASAKNGGNFDLSGELTIGRYYTSNFDINPNANGLIIEKNMHSYDQAFVDDGKNILKSQQLVYKQGDSDSFNQARAKSFMADNSESVLNPTVQDNPDLMNQIDSKGLFDRRKSTTTGAVKAVFINPWYLVNGANKVDSNASKVIFGESDLTKVMDNKAADDEYFFGRGRILRALLNSSVNLYGFGHEARPAAKTTRKVARNWELGQTLDGATTLKDEHDKGLLISPGIRTDVQQEKIYEASDKNDWKLGFKPGDDTYIGKIKTAFAKLLTDAGVTNASFPLLDFLPSDKKATPDVDNAYNHLVEYMNDTFGSKDNGTTGWRFTKFKRTEAKADIIINKHTAPLIYKGGGADYNSVASLDQQILSASYGGSFAAELIAKALNTQKIKTLKDDFTLGIDVDLTDLKNYLHTQDSSITGAIMNNISLTDWYDFQTGVKTQTLLPKINKLMVKFFKDVVSKNKVTLIKYHKILMGMHNEYKLFLGYPSYSSVSSPNNGAISSSKSYHSPWLVTASSPSIYSIGGINIIDTKVTG